MISLARRKAFTGLLLMTTVLLASGCASGGSYSGSASVGVYGGYGYYGGYPGYYGGNVVVGAPVHPGGVRPPGGVATSGRPTAASIAITVAAHAGSGPAADAVRRRRARRGRASLKRLLRGPCRCENCGMLDRLDCRKIRQ